MASSSESKPAAADDKPVEQKPAEPKATVALGEDDEFEDFPVDDWPEEQTEAASGSDPKHLWEESWDDDTNDDFSAQLREELKKVEAAKPRS